METYAGKKTLITGGLGFIGSNLALRLVELGAEVTLVDSMIPSHGGNLFNIEPVRGRVNVNISDVRDAHGLEYLVRGQDFIFNLAGQVSHIESMTDPMTDLEINSRSQLSLLEVARHRNPAVRIVFTGTRQVYGKPEYLPVDEKHPVAFTDVNGVNNFAGESFHRLYHDVYGIRACVLRLTNTYGPRQLIRHSRQGFIAWFIRNILDGKPIQVFGDGTQVRDLNYVDDVVEALLQVGQNDRCWGQVYNLGAPEHISLWDLAHLMVEVSGARVPIEKVPFPPEKKRIDIGDYYADYRKIREAVGWDARVSIRDGMKITFDYYRSNRRHYLDD